MMTDCFDIIGDYDSDTEIATVCFYCGGHIAAGSYPAVCSGCRDDFEFDCMIEDSWREQK